MSRPSFWSGEAGVGKTRLVAELTTRCVAGRTRVLAGGCVPMGGDGCRSAPIVEALRLPEEFGVDAMRELAGPSWQELARALPSLGESGTSGRPGCAATAVRLLLAARSPQRADIGRPGGRGPALGRPVHP